MKSDVIFTPFLHQLFETSLKGFEDAIAVVDHGQGITYKELNKKADNLSYAILTTAKDEEIIGISTSRSVEMIISILAILKAGKAYLPLDPHFPESRLMQVISNSKVKFCLARSSEEGLFNKIGLHCIATDSNTEFPKVEVTQYNPNACVLYTSGSTGKPKGVCVPHVGLVNFLLWQRDHSKAAPHLKTLQFCHLSFDVSIEEIFVPLITGGTLYLIDDNYRLDSGNLLEFIEANGIHRMYLPYVELQYFAEEAVRTKKFPGSLVEFITGGELLKITPQISTLFNALNNVPLKNKYGPTEASIWVTELELNGDASKWPEVPTIGKPFANTSIIMLNDKLEAVPDGEPGEICIHGICTANGYLNEPELTAKSFIDWEDENGKKLRLYRTGDLGRYLPDGNIEFHGRRDGQVKIRGNRVELADIEIPIAQQEGIQQAVVIAREDVPGKKYLAAYLVNRDREIDVKQLRDKLLGLLPDYMIPSYFIQLEDLPKTPSGKVDRKNLPKPEAKRPDFGVLYRKPSTEIEKHIAEVLINILQYDVIGVDDNFFELGGNSLLAQKTISELKHQYQYTVPITKLYQFPTIAGLAAYIQNHQFPAQTILRNERKKHPRGQEADIAVIGMSGRFPGANSVEALWEVLKSGKETITFFKEDEVDNSVPSSIKNDPMYVKARGIVEDADQFDPSFFGINPKLAELMDPQQRIFMEIAWEALENAGYFPQNGHSNIGVFAGSYNNTYYLNNVQYHKKLVDQLGEFQVMSANEKDYIASRTAYHLNLKGPAVSVYSACSTSLLAIAQAVESIRNGQCDMALAGGASINAPVNSGHLYQEGAMLSANGHCSPFDANSTGTLFSDGAGVVLLKPLSKAKEDGDNIFAVIKGVGINNDGGEKGSFTAPSSEGQAGAISMALQDAQVDPASIAYIEAHGTGTPLGDPIEIEGLGMAFGPQARNQYCALGSIKSNVGHLTAAAGVAGFIKAVLSLHNRLITPSLGFSKPNPNIDFENSPFYVSRELQNWESETVRRAGVSSFGVGGTNVHVVLEEFEGEVTRPETDSGRGSQLLTWSAKSPESLKAYGQKLSDFIKQHPEVNLADLAFTLQTTRAPFNHRGFMVASSLEELAGKMGNTGDNAETHSLKEIPGEVVFSFPGQGAQFLDMGKGLYEGEKVFRDAVDTCAELLKEYLNDDIRQVLYPEAADQEAEDKIKNTRYTQPALFVTEYALSQLLMSWGVQPSILCGHSIGEFVAAHLAGVFSLKDALKVIAARGLLISNLPKGSMLSVRSAVDKIANLIPEELSIAAVNTKNLSVVSGPDEFIATFAQTLDQHEIPNRIIKTSHAFHSSMMDDIVDDFKEVVQSVSLKTLQKPIISTVTGTWLKDEQASDPAYWADHLRKTVKFADALDTIFALDNPLFIEVGPGNVTSSLARQHMPGRQASIISSLERNEEQSDIQSLLKAVGQMWLNGIEPDWDAMYAGQHRRKILIPNYAFNKKRYWVDAPLPEETGFQKVSDPVIPAATGPANSTKTSRGTRAEKLSLRIKELLNESGIAVPDTSMSFLELGLDSLLLTQVSTTIKKEFDIPVTFRQLNEKYNSPALLIDYLDKNLPEEVYGKEQEETSRPLPSPGSNSSAILPEDPTSLYAALESVNRQLLQLSQQMIHMQQQLSKINREQTSITFEAPSVSANSGNNSTTEKKVRENSNGETKNNKFGFEGKKGVPYNGKNNQVADDYFSAPPVPGARLGKDQNGNPAWFVPNPDQEGGYLQLNE
ncbi:MAG TPA: amino acid adenylation domain-containing protein [Cyclobacteriaceae bacterium]|nr:amino acid adenylation domain-containing protein [Cyclobacteriaceae bacterium]